MNFRVQVLDRSGAFRTRSARLGTARDGCSVRKALDSTRKGHLYVVDGQWGIVQVFDREGRLLYYFGGRGTGPGKFQLPTGLQIDNQDRIYVVDSFNRRVQVFHYYGVAQADGEETAMKTATVAVACATILLIVLCAGVLRKAPQVERPTCSACTTLRRRAALRSIRRAVWVARSATLRTVGWAALLRCGTRSTRRRRTLPTPARLITNKATRSRRWA